MSDQNTTPPRPKRLEFITVSPVTRGYEQWHSDVEAVIFSHNRGVEEVTVFAVSVGAALHGIRATGVYLHPDCVRRVEELAGKGREWLVSSLACRLDEDAEFKFLTLLDEDATGWLDATASVFAAYRERKSAL